MSTVASASPTLNAELALVEELGTVQISEIETVCYVNELMARVPEELWMFMLMFLDDVDLQNLGKTCRLLQRLTRDALLWKAMNVKNKGRLEVLLFKTPQRATREWLAQSNIMRGRCLERKLSEGQYIGGDSAVRAYEAFIKIQMEATKKAVSKGLEERPPVSEMSEKNLIPPEVTAHTGSCSPRLIPKVIDLKKAMTLDSLKKQLRSRITVENFKELGVAKTHTVTTYNPTIHSKAVQLDKRLCEIHLVSKLIKRPSATLLESMNVLPPSPDNALWITPNVRSRHASATKYMEAAVSPSITEAVESPKDAGISPDQLSATTAVAPSPDVSNLSSGLKSPLTTSVSFTDVVA
ncbi:hypothetical protein HDU96_009585 [Phlyctochytrium bullatum]|nr:hypothetical protein HDU96_009585 [Phlyctochytrium bullatum]